uniref:Uncharacterized protein n=1 Tax=Oryza rufipogon TaxID=4529 RepID=A0A0E0P8E4_ORYRU
MWITCSACHQKVLNWLKSHKQSKLTLMPQRTDKNEALQATKAAILTLNYLKRSIVSFQHDKVNLKSNQILLRLWYWEKFRVSHIDPSTARVRPLIQYWDEKKARKREKIMYGVIRVLAPGNRHETVISGRCQVNWRGMPCHRGFEADSVIRRVKVPLDSPLRCQDSAPGGLALTFESFRPTRPGQERQPLSFLFLLRRTQRQ